MLNRALSLVRRALVPGLMLCLLTSGNSETLIPPGTEVRHLPNGMQVVVVPSDTPDVVALQLVMRVGSRDEVEEGKSGFAHFFEHLMFRGTERYPVDLAQDMLKEAGADSNAWTWHDQTVYHKVFLKDDLDRILDYEADRFMRLKYEEAEFRTEALAVLGEYNKNSSDPYRKMMEALQATAFDEHTYEHTTMGFLEDIEQYPEGYDYSWQFFDRFYRPEYASLVLVGDLDQESTFALVERYFGAWEPGSYVSEIPEEPIQTKARKAHIDWPSPTLPWLMVAYKAPSFEDLEATAALELWESLMFSQTGELYQKLVLEDKVVDQFRPFFWKKKDPFVVGLAVRVTDPQAFSEVQEQVYRTFEGAKKMDLSAERLERVKSRQRYSALLNQDSPGSVAQALAFQLSLDTDLEALDRYHRKLASVTPETLKRVAEEVFRPSGRTTVTLKQKERTKQ